MHHYNDDDDDDIDDDYTISKSYSVYLYILFSFIVLILIIVYIIRYRLIPNQTIVEKKIFVERTCYTEKMNPNTKYIPEVCPICLNTYENDEFISTLKCNHSFHEECIKEWYNIRDTEYANCPYCNEEFLFA